MALTSFPGRLGPYWARARDAEKPDHRAIRFRLGGAVEIVQAVEKSAIGLRVQGGPSGPA